MFDIAWSELGLIGAVALIVIGPKDLPKVMRTLGQWTRKARLLAGEFHHNVDEMLRQAELDEVRRQVQSINPAAVKAKMESIFDPKDIEAAILGETRPNLVPRPPVVPSEAQAAAEVPPVPAEALPPIAAAEGAAAEVPPLPPEAYPPLPSVAAAAAEKPSAEGPPAMPEQPATPSPPAGPHP